MLYSFFEGNFAEFIQLSERESHHLVSVRRGKQGESVTVLDGKGGIGCGEIENADPRAATIRIRERRTELRQGSPLWLAQAMPLGKTMDIIIQKAAELGAVHVVPLVTERSELRLDKERTEKKLEKWKLDAIEAIKQCGNPFLPIIDTPSTIRELVSKAIPSVRMVCSLEAGPRPYLKSILESDTHDGLIVAIGPEGDFSAQEYDLFRQNGFAPVTLGPLVLRSETAAISALAVAAEATRMK
jgi:16S rRNA (uracil1498-N3)-methyltransferase